MLHHFPAVSRCCRSHRKHITCIRQLAQNICWQSHTETLALQTVNQINGWNRHVHIVTLHNVSVWLELCSVLAAGQLLAMRISQRTVAVSGGILFLLFAAHNLVYGSHS